MSHRMGLARVCVVGAALTGAALVSTSALAEEPALGWFDPRAVGLQDLFAIDPRVYGCCEGGTASAANAWTNGNYASVNWPFYGGPLLLDTPLITKSAPVVAPVPYWWTHGEVEAGYRGFIKASPRDGQVYNDQGSLAGYYEYSTIQPGVFGGGHVAAGTIDGLYQVDIWANNIGYNDQSYWLNASKAGEHYLSFVWDSTPHLYSTSALTPYFGIGTGALVLGPGFPNGITTPLGVLPFLHQTDIGIERNTAAVEYRWTPTDAWDIRADYSHMSRTGSQVAGIVELNGFQPTEVPAPVDDTTQNFGANGEYAGTSLWGGKYTVKVAYNGSQYNDNLSSYTVQNPFFPTLSACKAATPTAAGTANCGFGQISTPPSNAANGVTGTMAADLPLLSRYTGTVSYTKMTQNDSFIPMTNNPLAVASPFNGGANWGSLAALPATSLNGSIDTLLSNNIITTKITPDLTSKLTYRYYDFDNQTPQIVLPCWISYDGTGVPISKGGNPCGGTTAAGTGFEQTISSLSISYIKQNAGASLNWRPSREWNFNAEYGFERYNYTETDVNVTNENTGKVSVDWKPLNWITARASGSYGIRNYDQYDYFAFVRSIQFQTVSPFTPEQSTSWIYAPNYRQFMFDHRQRTMVNFTLDVVAFPGVTVSPSFKYKDDNYGLNPLNEEGVNDSRQTSAGVDVGWVIHPHLSFTVSYYWEYYDQTLYNYTNTATTSILGLPAGWPYEAAPGNCTTGLLANCLINTSDKERVNTVTAVANWSAIPDALDIVVRYTVSKGVDQQVMLTAAPTGCTNCQGAFPDVTSLLQRLDATAVYKFDRFWLAQMGWTGDLKAKLRYTWEKNSVANWANDLLTPFTPGVSGSALFLGFDNPNYNVQMLAASLIASW
jgi:MtrB/PioB family decaheme-associated outer membrane protein